MKIRFLGAAGMVTGSNFLVESHGKRFLVDCGMVQGSKQAEEMNYAPFEFAPAEMDFLVLTHGHIDHSGRLPKLVKDGFKGPIYCHPATADLLSILLPDSAHIQQMETERFNRKRLQKGLTPVEPLYDDTDVRRTLDLVKPIPRDTAVSLTPGLEFTLKNSGHILGSCFARFHATTDKGEMNVVFSGDLGNSPVPILRDPDAIGPCDYLIMESTYGDRVRENDGERHKQLRDVIKRAEATGGRIIIPSFAVGRTQEILYCLSDLLHAGEIKPIDIVVDSPLATNATEIFRRHRECYDDATRKRIDGGDNPFTFPGLRFTQSADDSRALNEAPERMIIISASGMCTAGRIKHHLRHNLYKPDATVLFVGYQGHGTLGRIISEGAKMVRIHGEEVAVKANIEMIHGFSGHADQKGLLSWVDTADAPPRKMILVHGEPDAQEALKTLLEARGIPTFVPGMGDEITLEPGQTVARTATVVSTPTPLDQPDDRDSELQEEIAMLDTMRTQLAVLTSKLDGMASRLEEKLRRKRH